MSRFLYRLMCSRAPYVLHLPTTNLAAGLGSFSTGGGWDLEKKEREKREKKGDKRRKEGEKKKERKTKGSL